MNYISLFSSAGVGCYGFKLENYKCVATNEILEKRLNIQKFNNKCEKDSGYILGDITNSDIQHKLFKEVENQKIDIIIATPPCQGMSVANHKKRDEKGRNSLVVESIKIVMKVKPKFFIFENVRTFMNTICTDIDNIDKPISKAIELNLNGNYNILSKVINFKEYGSNSSRTRTLVIGVRKDIKDISPYDIFPKQQNIKTLKDVIGNFPRLNNMGEISKEDIYHFYRNFDKKMLAWIENIKEGESAFDNTEKLRIPHQIKDGEIVFNKNKNGDKYSRCYWNKSGACIHTRNDILASQNTIHPEDNRVFSIREIMEMMNIPKTFNWSNVSFQDLNNLSQYEKIKFLKNEELTIRKSIGEAVPTNIFQQIAHNIKSVQKEKKLTDIFFKLETSNLEKEKTSAYYTRQDIVFNSLQDIPNFKNKKVLHILEPSVGVGNFIPLLIEKYKNIPKVIIDVIDIDKNSLEHLKNILQIIKPPQNFTFNFINDDFILWQNSKQYDLVVGNPPYQKISTEQKIEYSSIFSPINMRNSKTTNLFAFFIEKAVQVGKTISFIVPKSLINTPEFNITRKILEDKIIKITDYGEKAFKGVKIETIGILISNEIKYISDEVKIESYITNQVLYQQKNYIFSKEFPYWLIYRNIDFDRIISKMNLGIFKSTRDRQITKKITKLEGNIRVLKSRNIGNNKIIDIKNYDTYIDNLEKISIAKFFNQDDLILIPNLTYNPRATFLPKNSIVDGSVAILEKKDSKIQITKQDLDYYSSDEFREYYRVARNFGTRSLNIDNNSVFFFGKLKGKYER